MRFKLSFRILFLSVLLSFPIALVADSWVEFISITALSEDGKFIVRVDPGKSLGDVYGDAGSPTGHYAIAHVYRYTKTSDIYRKIRDISLANPIGPVRLLINNRGWFATLDNWHNVGIGEVVVIYDRNGDKVISYKLSDLYSENIVSIFKKTTSSIWWRCRAFPPSITNKELLLWDALGGQFVFSLRKGTFKYYEPYKKCPTNR